MFVRQRRTNLRGSALQFQLSAEVEAGQLIFDFCTIVAFLYL